MPAGARKSTSDGRAVGNLSLDRVQNLEALVQGSAPDSAEQQKYRSQMLLELLDKDLGLTFEETRALAQSTQASRPMRQLAEASLADLKANSHTSRPGPRASSGSINTRETEAKVGERIEKKLKALATEVRGKILKVAETIRKVISKVGSQKAGPLKRILSALTNLDRGFSLLAGGDLKACFKLLKEAMNMDKVIKPILKCLGPGRAAKVLGKAAVPILGTGLYFWDAHSAFRKGDDAAEKGDEVASSLFEVAGVLNMVGGTCQGMSDLLGATTLATAGSAGVVLGGFMGALEMVGGGLAAFAEVAAVLASD